MASRLHAPSARTIAASRRSVGVLDVLGVVLAFGGGLIVSALFADEYLLFAVFIFALGIVSAMLIRQGRGWLVAATALWLAMEVVQVAFAVRQHQLGNGVFWLGLVMMGLLVYAFAALPALVGGALANRFFGAHRANRAPDEVS